MQGSDDIEAQAATVHYDITQHKDSLTRSTSSLHYGWFQPVALSRKPISGVVALLHTTAAHSTAVWILMAA